jgi:sodium pump decarboxylase gamma subunit
MLQMIAQVDGTMTARVNEALTLMAVGMLVVFGALILLWIAIFLIDRLSERLTPTPQPAQAPKPAPTPPSQPKATPEPSAGQDPKLIAVLTAAATAALGQRVRLRRVHFLGHDDQSWAREGRRVVMTSHSPHLHKRRR